MAGLIPAEIIAQVREQTDIVQIIGQHVELKRSGINHKGLCPFHEEKTPSFNVNSQRQFYHCFGCQESGDAINFLMKIEGRSFTEVVEDLAARAGIDVPRQQFSPSQAREAARRRSERQQGLDLNLMVKDLYRKLLSDGQGKICQDYLVHRGIGSEIIEKFQLGFAPGSGSVVTRMLESKKIPMDFAERLGVVGKRSQGRGYYDRFWNRLIFPIIGASGDVLGFGGRLLGGGGDDRAPKYINTPETMLYHKAEALFGLGPAAKPMRQKDLALVVEGNVDVLQLHQFGFDNAVAPMGTALTGHQVKLLRRFCHRVVSIFDGDAAGQAAALKSVTTLVEGALEARIATLPVGEDPDSFLRETGPEAFQGLIDRAVPAIEFMISTLRTQMDATIPGRARVLEAVAPVLARVDSRPERDLYIGRLALELEMDQRIVLRAVQGKLPRPEAALERSLKKPKEAAPPPQAELDVLGILIEHAHLVPRAAEAGLDSLLTNDELRATYRVASELQQGSGQIDAVALLEETPPLVRDLVANTIMSGAFAAVGDPTRALDDCLKDLRRRRLEVERHDILDQMARAKSEGDTEAERTLAIRRIEVEREIHETR